ncbi:flagellar protein FlaG [Thalassotalea marina]|uniref:Flagellar protein FlaG n=1 Tax=Thalassotalea marina TaxID=1673741 RepID=A0A919EHE3_9GAMM|nr:flagellar protein FlaG [Thalassotalea marina]GHF80284.1 hypothetical protein GCM10017161_04430 [Thalassotalea marina]
MVRSVSVDFALSNQVSELAQSSTQNDIKQQSEAKVGEAQNATQVNFPRGDQAVAKKDNEQDALSIVEKQQKSQQEEQEELEKAVETVSDFMSMYNRNVNFSLDEKSDKTIIKVFDADSKELIKQFPSEDLIKVAQKINGLRQDLDLQSGIFLDEKV